MDRLIIDANIGISGIEYDMSENMTTEQIQEFMNKITDELHNIVFDGLLYGESCCANFEGVEVEVMPHTEI